MRMASAHGSKPQDTNANLGTNNTAKIAGNITSQRNGQPGRNQKQQHQFHRHQDLQQKAQQAKEQKKAKE